MPKPSLVIQIVNYKTKNFLEPLIESILKDLGSSRLIYEINILDNDSGDSLEDLRLRYQNQHLRVYQADKNRGFGAGHNELARYAQAHYLLILNPDILFIEKGTIKRLIDSLEQNNAAVVGPRLLTKAHGGSSGGGDLQPQMWDHGAIGKSEFHFRPSDELTEAGWVSGAVFLIRRDTFEQVGGFDERFFLYFEEVDLCLRLRKLSYKIFYEPNIQVLHYGGVVAKKKSLYAVKSFLYFRLKHPLHPWSA